MNPAPASDVTSNRPPWRERVAALVLLLAGLALLQSWVAFLWPERARVGFAMPLGMFGEERIPHLGAFIYFVPLGILTVGALLRFASTRPRALVGLAVDTGSATEWVRSVAVLSVLYGTLGLLAAAVEHAVFHHFVTGPAHHVVIVVVLVGLYGAGRRRPFLRVTLSPPVEDAERRRRRVANAICVISAIALYSSWLAHDSLTRFAQRLDGWETALFVLATLPPAALFGWALLHSALADVVAKVVRRLEVRFEGRASESRPRRDWPATVAVACAHFGVAASLLGLGRLLWRWADSAWSADASTRFAGVDWYFVNVWSAVTAAEAVTLPAVALFAGIDLVRGVQIAPGVGAHQAMP